MKNHQAIIAVVVSGILSVSAQARQNEKDSHRNTSKVPVQKVIQHTSHGYQVQNSKKVSKLPRNHRRISHRGVTYYVAGGVYYQAVRSGFIVVKKPR